MRIIAALLLCLPLWLGAKSSDSEEKEIKKLPSGITYELRGQSFGQNMLSYFHAKWQTHVNKIPLHFKPFPYSNQLALYKEERKSAERRFARTVKVKDENDIIYMDPAKTLYTIPFFAEVDPEITEEFPPPPYFTVLWEDHTFTKKIRKLCKPVSSYKELSLPKGRVSIALHVRRGLRREIVEEVSQNPAKFPPNSYYVEQMRKLNEIFKGIPLYVHVFTDYKFPEEIMEELEKELELPNVLFGCRKGVNNSRAHVVDDFYNMSRFMCLIRPISNFSLVAELIGHHAIVIKPVGQRLSQSKKVIVIDKVHRKIREKE